MDIRSEWLRACDLPGSTEHAFAQLAMRLNMKETLRLEQTTATTTLTDSRFTAHSTAATELGVGMDLLLERLMLQLKRRKNAVNLPFVFLKGTCYPGAGSRNREYCKFNSRT